MGRNVFVSYKYSDDSVCQFSNLPYGSTTVRDYVDDLAFRLDKTDRYYYRGEQDGEDLSEFDPEIIESELRDKMFQTSITIVMISPRMFENISEIEQWIPWEIAYSLKNKSRSFGKSYMNAILAIVLPDRRGEYDYAMYSAGRQVFVKEDAFFEIILANMFNRRGVEYYTDRYNNPQYKQGESYIALAKWCDFCSNPEYYMGVALKNRGEWDQFDIVKRIDEDWIS